MARSSWALPCRSPATSATDFSQFIQKAKDADADVMIAQVTPPDAAALWKQMKDLGYHPVTAWPEKGGTVGFPKAVGPLAEGASVFGYRGPNNGSVSGQALRRLELVPVTVVQHGDGSDHRPHAAARLRRAAGAASGVTLAEVMAKTGAAVTAKKGTLAAD